MDSIKQSRNFRDYKVWQDSVDYATQVYRLTSEMPWFEKKGLCDQLQRAAVSISSNIAEGSARPTDADFVHFLDVALGSAYEVETQLLICNNIGYLADEQYQPFLSGIKSIQVQLSRLIGSIRSRKS